MRRLILILTGLLLGGTLTAQNLSRCEYWFDQDYAARQVVLYTGDSLPTQVDASSLSVGLHSLVLLMQDTGGTWSSPRSFMFLHYPTPQSATATYTYWFDQNHVNSQNGALTSGNMLVDASMLTAGPHFLTVMCQMGSDIRVEQHLFYHFPDVASAPATYTCWFDQNYAAAQTDSLVNGTLTVDASSLTPGMHQFTIICQVGSSSRVEQHLFYKMPDATNLTFHYRVDGGAFQTATTTVAGAVVDLNLDMTALAEGNHTIEHYVTGGDNDVLTTIQIDTFERTHMPVHYTLTAVAADSTMGSVTGGGFWIENTDVTIEAIPAEGYHFTQWSDGDTMNPRVVTLTSDTSFTAYFEEDVHYYTVTVLVASGNEGMGTVSEGGTWAEGEQVTIEAYPINGYHFTQWNDGVTDNPRVITLTSDTTFTACFEEDIHYYTVTVLVASGNEGMGTVSEGGTWAEGEQVTIEAYPFDGHLFSHWNDADTTNPRIIVLTSDTTFTAYFIVEPVGIDECSMEQIAVYGQHGNIVVSLETPRPIWVYNVEGRLLVQKPADGALSHTFPVPDGVYIVKVGDGNIRKVVVTE